MKWRLLLPLLLSVGAVALFDYWQIHSKDYENDCCQYTMTFVAKGATLFAKSHSNQYPDGKTSNEAFRQMFLARNATEKRPLYVFEFQCWRRDDEDAGIEYDFFSAPNDPICSLNYVRGLTPGKTDPTTPLLFMQVAGADGNIWMISVLEGGQSDIYRTTNGAVLQEQNGQQVDIFSEAYLKEKYGILPQDILKPEGPHRDITALAHQRKMEILRIEAAIILLIWLPFLIPLWIKHRRKPQPHPETPTPQA